MIQNALDFDVLEDVRDRHGYSDAGLQVRLQFRREADEVDVEMDAFSCSYVVRAGCRNAGCPAAQKDLKPSGTARLPQGI